MNFETWLRGSMDGRATLSEIYFQKDLLRWERTDTCLYASYKHLKERPLWLQDMFARYFDYGGDSMLLQLHCMTQALAYGPKVLRLRNLDFAILEQTDVNLHICDYTQPYKTIIVELPEAYQDTKEVPDILNGMVNFLNYRFHSDRHKPVCAVVCHEKSIEAIMVTVYMETADCYSILLSEADLTIEEQIEKKIALGPFDKSLPIHQEESIMYKQVIKAALNACLFADEMGMKKDGSNNEKHRRRLEHFVDVARKSNDKKRLAKAQRELNSIPIYYSFEQEVKLITETPPRPDGDGNGGWYVKPHWRRGHYRMQRHGKGLTEKKRLRIEAVFVNEWLYKGDGKDAKTTLQD